MAKALLILILGVWLIGADLPTCYSVQLKSAKEPFTAVPQGCEQFNIGGVYTIRCGCMERYKEIEPLYERLRKKFPNSLIVKTYKFRFQKEDIPQVDLKALARDVERQIDFTPFLPLRPARSTSQNPVALSQLRWYVDGGVRVADLGDYRDDYFAKLGVLFAKEFERWGLYGDLRFVFRRYRNESSFDLDLKELYALTERHGWYLLVGRKVLKDRRSWIYNDVIDTVGLYNDDALDRFRFFLGKKFYRGGVFDGEIERRDSKDHAFALASWRHYLFYNRYVEATYLYDEEEHYAGLRYFGRYGRWDLLGDTLWSRGVGVDMEAAYWINEQESIGARLAYGSKNFRQPLFANNRSNYLTPQGSINYYGELLRPRLHNLWISSLLYRYLSGNSGYFLALSNYRRVSDRARVDMIFEPKSKNIGQEVDLGWLYRVEDLSLKLIGSYFTGDEDGYGLYCTARYYW